jgi:hypothetical protein
MRILSSAVADHAGAEDTVLEVTEKLLRIGEI